MGAVEVVGRVEVVRGSKGSRGSRDSTRVGVAMQVARVDQLMQEGVRNLFGEFFTVEFVSLYRLGVCEFE